MKILIRKPITIADQPYEVGAVLDIDDQATCDALIASGDASEFTAEVEAQEQAEDEETKKQLITAEAQKIKVEQKSFKAEAKNKASAAGDKKIMKDILCKSFKDALTSKAVSDVAGVTATEFLGYVTQGQSAKIWNKIYKLGEKEMIKLVYENGAPTISTVSEGGTNAQSALPIAKIATSIKKFASFNVPTEYYDFTSGMENYLAGGVQKHVLDAVIKDIVDGTAKGASFTGLEGIQASDDCKSAQFVSMTAPTKDELLAWKNLIFADLRDNMIFVTPSDFAAGIEAALLNEGNVGNQLIDMANGKLFGKDWIITDAITTPVCGDFSKYLVNVARPLKTTATENAATDTVVTGVSVIVCGGIAYKAGTTQAAFAKAIVKP